MALPSFLRTARLTLRLLDRADLPVLVREIGRWEVAQWLIRVPHPYAMADAEWWLDHTRTGHRDGTHLFLVAVPEGGTEMVGGVGLHRGVYAEDAAELGYWLAPAAWGRGYATEMARAVVAAGFGHMPVAAIQAVADVRNQASNGVLRKAGLALVGTDADHSRGLRGGTAPANIYRITRQEFEATHVHA